MDKLKNLIANNEIKELFIQLNQSERLSMSINQRNQVAILENQYTTLREEFNKGTIRQDDFNIFHNRIISRLLFFIDNMDQKEDSNETMLIPEKKMTTNEKWFNKKVTPLMTIVYFIFVFEIITLSIDAVNLTRIFITSLTKLFLIGLIFGIFYHSFFYPKRHIESFKISFPIPLLTFFIIAPFFAGTFLYGQGIDEKIDLVVPSSGSMIIFIAANLILNLILGFLLGLGAYYGSKLSKWLIDKDFEARLNSISPTNYIPDIQQEVELINNNSLKIKIWGGIGLLILFLLPLLQYYILPFKGL